MLISFSIIDCSAFTGLKRESRLRFGVVDLWKIKLATVREAYIRIRNMLFTLICIAPTAYKCSVYVSVNFHFLFFCQLINCISTTYHKLK
uniref:Ovule protein n=1 Tax=Heterorhabditis bacteriophora TaxID=37862 RepID=A0A1I7WIL8_HETBA